MAIQHGLWKIGEKPQHLTPIALESEELLEQQIFEDISILNAGWMLIGRQVRTRFGKFIDLLAVDANGSLIVIELKRDKTPRDVVAQTIDYASWIVELSPEQVVEIYLNFTELYGLNVPSLDHAFEQRFGVPLQQVELNGDHKMVVVAARLDAGTERIINYLNDYAGIPINAVFFTAFADGGNQYLSRSWMIAPEETQERAISKSQKEPWNHEFYVSFGHNQHRHWDDARQYGFISAGGGLWYSKTLNMLSVGDRIWVNIPKTGYVGVAQVTGEVALLADYRFETPDGLKTLIEAKTAGHYVSAEEEDNAEYLVPVEWIKALPAGDAFSEVGLFGNQNSVCKPTAAKWSHTVERLKQTWDLQ